jgi:hypothetical protein
LTSRLLNSSTLYSSEINNVVLVTTILGIWHATPNQHVEYRPLLKNIKIGQTCLILNKQHWIIMPCQRQVK